MAQPNQARNRTSGESRRATTSGTRAVRPRDSGEVRAAQSAPTVRPPKLRPPEVEENEIRDEDGDRPTPVYPRFARATYVSIPDEDEPVVSPGRYSQQNVEAETLGSVEKKKAPRAAAAARAPSRGNLPAATRGTSRTR